LAGWPPVTKMIENLTDSARLVEGVAAFSVMTHFDGFQRGVFNTRDLVFFLALIGFSLFTTSVIIRAHRVG
jgi:ABC-2 type transport system permease protein